MFLSDLLTGHEPGRARRPCRAGKSAAQVQVKRRLTGDGSPYRPRAFVRFMGSPSFLSDLLTGHEPGKAPPLGRPEDFDVGC